MFQHAHSWWLDSPFWFESGVSSEITDRRYDREDTVIDFSLSVPSWYKPWMTSRQSFIDKYDDVIGSVLVGWGAAMMVPGPFDVLAAGAGLALTKHPAGAIAGVVAYNAFAWSVFGLGLYLTSLD